MADARYNRSLSPDIRPAQDAARPELRASDADRDHTAAVLGNGLATGRLTSTEHAERLDAAYTATTLGELALLTRDLPADDAAGTGVGAVDRAEVAARFSKVIRSGRWVAGRRTRLTAHFGALIVNLADAVLPGREITLEIDAFCGKLIMMRAAGAHGSTRAARCSPSGPSTAAETRGCRRAGDQARRRRPVLQGRRAPRRASTRTARGGTGCSSRKPPSNAPELPEHVGCLPRKAHKYRALVSLVPRSADDPEAALPSPVCRVVVPRPLP